MTGQIEYDAMDPVMKEAESALALGIRQRKTDSSLSAKYGFFCLRVVDIWPIVADTIKSQVRFAESYLTLLTNCAILQITIVWGGLYVYRQRAGARFPDPII